MNVKDMCKTIAWSLRRAWRIDARLLLLWGILSVLVALLPAVMLRFNQRTVSILSQFLLTGHGAFSDIVPSVLALGAAMTALGVSQRFNGNFLYFMMYDTYYFGMQEYMMDSVNRIEYRLFMDRDFRNRHSLVCGRLGAMTDFLSSGCLFLCKLIAAGAVLAVVAGYSPIIFYASFGYIALALTLNFALAPSVRWDGSRIAQEDRLAGHYQQAVMTPGVAREIRIYGSGGRMEENWDKVYGIVHAYKVRLERNRFVLSLCNGLGYYLLVAAILGYSIWGVARGDMTVDIFLVLWTMSQSISEIIQTLSTSLSETDRGLHFLDLHRKFEADYPPHAQEWEEGFEPAREDVVFSARDLSFSYDGRRMALRNLSFDIHKGETIALVGLNGSGKTTLVKLLIGLFTPAGGTLEFKGRAYDAQTRGAIVRQVGMFFQDFYTFHASLRENVGFGDLKRLNDDARILQAMEKGDALRILARLEQGLSHWLGRNVKKEGAILSGGERQRVAVSRAHMSDKDILIFDEPAAALDPMAEMLQFQTIREKIQDRTAILISHRVGFARLADRIFVLDGGALAQVGTHEALMAQGGIYADFFREQAKWYERADDMPQEDAHGEN